MTRKSLWRTTLSTARQALSRAGVEPSALAGLGITNQRETTLVWSRTTGRPIHNAIVWQDRRTAPLCAELKERGCETLVSKRAGLLLDPYFSATKIAWILDNVPGARAEAERGDLAFGTVDSFLVWRLTNGKVHVTDATNASRTLLFNIHSGAWDDDLLALFRVPRSMLPEVKDCAAEFGEAAAEHLGVAIPIRGIAGDQQAALIGQACFRPGMVKSTYGTGCFALVNTGDKAVASTHKLLTTIAYQFSGKRTYRARRLDLLGGRDGAMAARRSRRSRQRRRKRANWRRAPTPAKQVYLVPAFTGLGAPHWDSEARAAIFGLTRGATRKEIVRAALESVGYQTRDLIDAMRADSQGLWGGEFASVIRIDGGMSASDWTMQFLADMLDAQVDRPEIFETTALGAGYLAGWQAGLYPDPDAVREDLAAAGELHAVDGGKRTRIPLSRLARRRRAHGSATGDLELMRIVFRCDPAIENELMRPVAARAALPDWLRAMPRTAFSDLHGQEVRTVKQCPPFVDAMSHGFIIPLPCDVTVRDGVLSWDWDHPALTVEAHPRSPVSFHVPAQVDGHAVLRSRSRDREVQQLLDDRARAGLFAVRHSSREPRGSAVPLVDRGRRLRSLHRCRHLVSRRLDGCEFRRRAAPRHARSRSASRSCARRSSFNSSRSRRKKRSAISRPRTMLLSHPGAYRRRFRVRRERSSLKRAAQSS